jgi:hypothetical protein
VAKPRIEKRSTRRFDLQLPAAVADPPKADIAAMTRDVSPRGVCFTIKQPLQVGSNLKLTLLLPSEVTLTEPVRVLCTARVVRVEAGSEEQEVAVAAAIERYEFLAQEE